MDYAEHSIKALPTNREKFNSIEGKCLTGYKQEKGEDWSGREFDLDIIPEQLQMSYLYMYEGVQGEVYHHNHHHHQVLSSIIRLNVMDLHFSLFSAFLIHSL